MDTRMNECAHTHTRGPLSVSLISELTCGSAWIWLWWLLTGSRNCFLLCTLYSPLFSCFSSLWPTRCLASGNGYSWLLKSLVTPSSAPLRWTDNTNGLSLYLWSSCRLQEEHFLKKSLFFFLSYWLKFIRKQKKKEKIEENLCHLTRTEWEGLKNITDPWPFLRDQGGIDLSIISVSLSLSLSCTHFIFSTCAQTNMHCCMKCCRCTCRWGFGLCDERRHGRVGVQPVAKHVGGGQVEDRAWESAHLWTETNKQWHMRHKKPHFLSDLTLYNIMTKPAVFR